MNADITLQRIVRLADVEEYRRNNVLRFVFALVLVFLIPLWPAKAEEKIQNGGFESGSASWQTSGGTNIITTLYGFKHSGSYYAWLGGINGQTNVLYQDVPIPSNASTATLSFYYNINSLEGNTTAYDTFSVTTRRVSGPVIEPVLQKSNRDQHQGPGNPYYQLHTFPLNMSLADYKGQTIRIYFTSVLDSNKETNFRVDDVSLQVTTCTAVTWYRDNDGDGYGNPSNSTTACTQPSGYVSNSSDCNDSSSSIKPGAAEVCDGADNNCNGQTDEGVGSTWYRDNDGDGYGSSNNSTTACTRPTGYVSNSTDCNDNNSSIKPGATEVCDGADNNCNGQTDEGVGSTWYRDNDGDGYGSSNNSTTACTQPTGYVSSSTDCNDNNSSIKPGAAEVCDGADNNCNGQTDEGVGSTWYRDNDGDGYGSSGSTTTACTQPTGYVSNSTDCNDNNSSIKPGAAEVCDGADNNCNGQTDENGGSTWYRDNDGDGYGSSGSTTTACTQPTGYVSNSTDCNDNNSNIKPGATEVSDGQDNDCDGQVDEQGSIVARTITNNNTSDPSIRVAVTPESTVSASAVEETLSVGLTPTSISENGSWDSTNRKVKWGPFFDTNARTLTYHVNGTAGTYTLSGIGSFDGVSVAITGDSTVNVTANPQAQVQFSSAAYSVSENGGSATITVARTGATAGAVSVNFATSNGTATAGQDHDYTATTTTINFGDGETNKTVQIPVANDTAPEGNETVNLTLSNPTGGATLGTPNTAVLTIIDNDDGVTASHITNGYYAGGTCTINCTITYNTTPNSLGWEATIPTGWSYASDTSGANVKPNSGDTQVLGWAWFDPLPASPVSFSYTLSVPAGETSGKQISATLGIDAQQYPVQPNPLTCSPILYHSTDSGRDWKISLFELLRVIQHFNHRAGTVRTGEYHVDIAATDGYAPGPGTQTGRHHSGDSGRDWKISLFELLRVIQHFNYRDGTVRTGQYHVDNTTVDGYAPGPPSAARSGGARAEIGDADILVDSSLDAARSEGARAGLTANHSATAAYYTPGSTVTVNCQITYEGTPSSLGWEAAIPTEWSYASGNSGADLKPNSGDTQTLGWAWYTAIPASPVRFSFTVNVPANAAGLKSISGIVATDTTQATATPNPLIIEQPSSTVTLTANKTSLAENGSQNPATVTATLSAVQPQSVTVNLAFSGAAASTSSDYTRSGTTITIPAGRTGGSVTISTVQDGGDEPDETVVVDIDSVINGTEQDTQRATITIMDDDPPTTSVGDFVWNDLVGDGIQDPGEDILAESQVLGVDGDLQHATLHDAGLMEIVSGRSTDVTAQSDNGNLTFDLNLAPGWSLISIPIDPSSPNLVEALQGEGVDLIWGWTGKEFREVVEIVAGRAYWVYKKGEASLVTIRGQGVNDATIRLRPGWNLVGPMANPPYDPISLPLNSEVAEGTDQIIHPIRAWAESQYIEVEELVPGLGYYIFVRDGSNPE